MQTIIVANDMTFIEYGRTIFVSQETAEHFFVLLERLSDLGLHCENDICGRSGAETAIPSPTLVLKVRYPSLLSLPAPVDDHLPRRSNSCLLKVPPMITCHQHDTIRAP